MTGYSIYHGCYLSHQITLEGLGEGAFAKSLSTARVDMNPHQVEAALFALKSPVLKGVILADEVGLGKTIEAGLVIAQRWAERKRRILLIVPSSLRKQWQQELNDKFSLQSSILETKTFNDVIRTGHRRPFDNAGVITITSYEFASRKADDLILVPWDLVVFDEAHRLRNVYRKNGSKRAKVLRDALKAPFKILLTATPLQNSLMELFGLVSCIDDIHFGGEAAYKAMYVGMRENSPSLTTLKQRLAPICHRTLRRQVQEAGHINYTQRKAVTFDFDPSEREAHLYSFVSDFLKRKDTISYGERSNQLVILQVRKILGSSTFAVSKYLEQLIARLESKGSIDETVTDDIDTFDEVAEEFDDEEPHSKPISTPDPIALQKEVELLKGFLALAHSIGKNAKGEKLVQRLPQAMDMIVKKGGNRKAVIFTESVRTQTYLAELFNQNGYAGQIVLMNGSNNDAESRAIYGEWRERHRGTDRISASRTADMKAALVEAFRSPERSILIATESGAEGINLQFCSLVVNFDLPWNPQRIEQRIGRCHRYGQKIDVTVVNMLNRKNKAEERIYELLEQKFRLFSGVFGSSDEVLGSIERGIDFEKKVLEIVQSARDDEQVQKEFDLLTGELQDNIDSDMQAARSKLLEELDETVVARLKDREGTLTATLNEFSRRLTLVARAELPEAKFHALDSPRFDYKGSTWTTEWPIAEQNDWQFFRLAEGNLATLIVEQCKLRRLLPVTLKFCPAHYPFPGQLVDLKLLSGKSGWLRISKARIDTPNAAREEMLLACLADDGSVIDAKTADRFFLVPCESQLDPIHAPEPQELREIERHQFTEFASKVERENTSWLEEEEERLDAYSRDVEVDADAQIKEIEEEVKELKKQRRAPNLSMEEKLNLGRKITRRESDRDDLVLGKHERRREIRQRVEQMLDDVASNLNQTPTVAHVFTVCWSMT